MRILVTGSTGFIGSRLIDELLAHGHELNLLVVDKKEVKDRHRRSSKIKIFKVDILKDDLSDSFKNIEVVIHLAAVRHRWGVADEEYIRINEGLTGKLLDASKTAKIKQFIFCSSIAVYGWPQKHPIDETFTHNPVNAYGKSKVECEEMVRGWSDETGIPFSIIRPSITYGEGDYTGMMTKLISLVKSGKYMTVGNGRNHMQLVFIDDLVTAFRKAVNNQKAFSEDFIVTYAKPITINDLVILTSGITGNYVKNIHIPKCLARIPATILEWCYKAGLSLTGNEPIITNEKIDLMTYDRSYSVEKARKLLGYEPKFGYSEGIKITYLWNKKNNLV